MNYQIRIFLFFNALSYKILKFLLQKLIFLKNPISDTDVNMGSTTLFVFNVVLKEA